MQTSWLGAVELEVQALEADRLADPHAGRSQQLEQHLVLVRGHRQHRRQLLAAEHLYDFLLLGDRLAVGKRQALAGVVADQALRGERGGERRDRRDLSGPGHLALSAQVKRLVRSPSSVPVEPPM